MLLPKVALSDVAKDVVDDDFERATTQCSEQVLGLSADHRRIVRRYDGPVGIVTNRANKITAGFDYVAKNVAVKVGQVEQAETPFAPGSNGEQPRVVCRSGLQSVRAVRRWPRHGALRSPWCDWSRPTGNPIEVHRRAG